MGNIAKESRFGRPNIITWSGMSWMSSATSTSQQQTCDGKTEIVFEADQHIYRCQNWREESQRHHSLELRHGRSLSKVCWTLLPPGAQDGWQTPQGFHTSFGRSSSKTRRPGNCERVFRDLLSDCIDMLVLGNNWKTRFTLDRELLGNISHTSGTESAIRNQGVSSVTFITHPTTDNFVTLGNEQQTANLDYSKTPILQEIWLAHSQRQVVLCAYLYRIRLCQLHGLVNSRLLNPTAAKTLKLYRLMQGYAWRAFHGNIASPNWRWPRAYSSNTNTKASWSI